MRIGLIGDLAIGMDRAGSHAWARQSDLLLGLSVGAPPDIFNPRGQDWGLTGFSPRALQARGFEPFRIGQPVIALLIVVDHGATREHAISGAASGRERESAWRGAGVGDLELFVHDR